MSHIKEAMALAGMNPVVGMAGPHHGSFIVNVTNHDKDLGDDGKLMTGLSKSLDMDDNLYGIDDNGKFFAKKKYTVMERKDIVEAYGITKNCDDIYKLIEEELRIPYENRPVHGQNYVYELVTGHDLLTEDQMQYDTLLEKIDLEKMSNALGGVTQGNLEGAPGLKSKGNKQAGYIPDTDWPQGTENIGDPTLSLEGTTPKFTTRFSNKGGTQKLSMNLKSPDEKWNKKIKVRDTKNGHEESSEESFVSIQEDLQKLKEIGDSKFEVPFYSWNEAKDILSPEHKKLFKEYLESRANFLESMEGVDEAFDLKVKLYHGSAEKYNVLKPVSYNDGNRLQSKAWSIFFWDDKELAKHWAVFVSMLSVYRDIRDKTGIKIGRPIGQHVKVGFNKYQYKIFVRKEDFDIYKQKLNGKTAYVYTAELPIYKIGIGNNSFQPEYTYNGSVTPSKTEPLKITTQLMAQYCTLISDEQYSKYKEDSSELTKPIRGFLNPLFNNNNGSIERWKHIYRKIHAGKAKPGDDLDTLLSDFPKEELLSLTEVGLDTVNESVWNAFGLKGGPHLTLYHGSPDKFDQIKPTSLTVGNSMHKPGWAVFMFDDKRLAMAYAMGITIQIKFADWFKENKIDAPIGWFENDTGFFKYKPVNIVDETNYEKILKKVIGTKFYIYTLQVPIDKDLNMIGTTNTIPEYTYTGIPKMVRCEEMTITKELFDAQYKQVSTTVFQMYKARKMAKKSLYGPWMKMFVNMDTRGTKRKLVLKTLKLEPGSDLSFLSTIIGKDDYHHDVGKWLEGKNKTLYVLGLSGSGKTTMTNNLSKLLNIPVIHIDEIHHRVSKENGGGNAWKAKMNKQARRDLVWNEVQKQAQKYDHRVIIDGGPMILHKVPDLEKQSYIIPGTSVITSTFRMIKRTLSNDTKQGLPAFQREYKGKSKIDMIKNMLKIIYSCASGNFKLNKEFQALKTHNE